jgi:hypothetical protein
MRVTDYEFVKPIYVEALTIYTDGSAFEHVAAKGVLVDAERCCRAGQRQRQHGAS